MIKKYRPILQKYIPLVLISLILLFSLIIRLITVNKGLPLYPHPDERDFVVRALQMIQRVSLDPLWYAIPGTTFMYLLVPFYTILFLNKFEVLTLLTSGNYPLIRTFIENEWSTYIPDLFTTYTIARIVNSIVAVGVIVLTYKLALEISKSKTIGIISATILAVSPLFFNFSTLARADILALFFMLLSMTSLSKFISISSSSNKFLLMSAIWAGIAVATRYHAVALMVPIGVVALRIDFPKYKTKLINFVTDSLFLRTICSRIIAVFFIAMYIVTPATFLNPKVTVSNLTFETRTAEIGQASLTIIGKFVWYIKEVLIEGSGSVFIFVLFLLGAIILIHEYFHKKDFTIILPYLFPLTFFLMLLFMNLHWARWLIPFLPYESILAAYVVYKISNLLSHRFKLNQFVFIAIITIGVTALPAYSLVSKTNNTKAQNSDSLVIEWINTNLYGEKSISIEGLPNSLLQKYATSNNLYFSNISIIHSINDQVKYVVLVENPSQYIYCYKFFSGGKGDKFCNNNYLHDQEIQEQLLKDYEKITVIEVPKNYRGLPYSVYERK